MKKICIVVASELTVRAFLLHHLAALSKIYAVTVVAAFDDLEYFDKSGLAVTTRRIEIKREISPAADLFALVRLVRLFRAEHYDLVHSVTPKAGLLAMIAARLAGVPVRVHTFTGQVWITRSGFMRALLRCADRAIARNATAVLVDSPSQRDFLIREGIIDAPRSRVLAKGSISGVDMTRFRPDPAARGRVRTELGITNDALVFLYLGRISRDKGLLDLARAFAKAETKPPGSHLLLVGPDEDAMRDTLGAVAGPNSARLHLVGETNSPEAFFAAADVFCLPSYREGFGTTIIEAAACGIPSIGSRIYGITDAIAEGATGRMFNPGDVNQLAECMNALAQNEALRAGMGRQARERALHEFSAATVTAALMEYYAGMLRTANAQTQIC